MGIEFSASDLVKEFPYPFVEEWVQDPLKSALLLKDEVRLPLATDKVEKLGGLDQLKNNIQKLSGGDLERYLVLAGCRETPLTGAEIVRFSELAEHQLAVATVYHHLKQLMTEALPRIVQLDGISQIRRVQNRPSHFNVLLNTRGYLTTPVGIRYVAALQQEIGQSEGVSELNVVPRIE